MCGRFTLAKEKNQVLSFLNKHFAINKIEGVDLPRYNLGPGQELIALIFDGEKYRAGLIQWNYRINIKGKSIQVINARSESIHKKVTFMNAFKNKRCIILSDGFYEWDRESKQAYRFIMKQENIFFYAGIYDKFTIDEKLVFASLILTTKANELVGSHHDRMPVILGVDEAKAYLRYASDLSKIQGLLLPYSDSLMEAYPVSHLVNKMSIDSPELIKKTTNN